jgi:hypothetical protein
MIAIDEGGPASNAVAKAGNNRRHMPAHGAVHPRPHLNGIAIEND